MNYLCQKVLVGFFVFGLLFSFPVNAQENKSMKDDLKLTFEAMNADMKKAFEANMQLSEKEKYTFWPIYDQYEKAMTQLNASKVRMINKYYEGIFDKNSSEIKSLEILNNYFSLQEERLKIKKLYISKFQSVLDDSKVARFFQLDNKIEAIIDFDLARKVPLVPYK